MQIEEGPPSAVDGRPFALFIVGPTCCGKTEAGSHLAQQGFTWIEPSQFLKDRVPLDVPILARLKMVDNFLESTGRDFVAKSLFSEVLRCKNRAPLVITGCRQMVEVDSFRERFQTVVVVLYSDDNTRFERCIRRGRTDTALNFETFLRATAWEYSLGLARLMFEADQILLNNGSIFDLRRKVERIVGFGRDCEAS